MMFLSTGGQNFSTWEDYRGLLRTGTILKIHEIVKNFSKPSEIVEDIDAYIENIF